MANFPDSIYTPREKENRSGVAYNPLKKNVLFAEDIQNDDDEIVAIETELGLNPKGAFASVAENLSELWSAIAGFVSSFLELSDTPDSYADQAGKVVKVNATEDGLEFGDAGGGGSFSRGLATRLTSAGTGTFNIAHGLGVAPKLIHIYAMSPLYANNPGFIQSHGHATSASDEGCSYITSVPNGTTRTGQDSSHIIKLVDANNNIIVTIEVSELNSTNIVLNVDVDNGGNDYTIYLEWSASA